MKLLIECNKGKKVISQYWENMSTSLETVSRWEIEDMIENIHYTNMVEYIIKKYYNKNINMIYVCFVDDDNYIYRASEIKCKGFDFKVLGDIHIKTLDIKQGLAKVKEISDLS